MKSARWARFSIGVGFAVRWPLALGWGPTIHSRSDWGVCHSYVADLGPFSVTANYVENPKEWCE